MGVCAHRQQHGDIRLFFCISFLSRLCFKTKVGRKKLSSVREKVNEIFIRVARSLLDGSKYVVVVVVVVVTRRTEVNVCFAHLYPQNLCTVFMAKL